MPHPWEGDFQRCNSKELVGMVCEVNRYEVPALLFRGK
jgi:hypothetical protein